MRGAVSIALAYNKVSFLCLVQLHPIPLEVSLKFLFLLQV